MRKYQIYVYREGELVWITGPKRRKHAQQHAENFRYLGYEARVRAVFDDRPAHPKKDDQTVMEIDKLQEHLCSQGVT